MTPPPKCFGNGADPFGNESQPFRSRTRAFGDRKNAFHFDPRAFGSRFPRFRGVTHHVGNRTDPFLSRGFCFALR